MLLSQSRNKRLSLRQLYPDFFVLTSEKNEFAWSKPFLRDNFALIDQEPTFMTFFVYHPNSCQDMVLKHSHLCEKVPWEYDQKKSYGPSHAPR
jgi:hypothetical protein